MAEIRVCALHPENLDEVAAYLAEVRRAELPAGEPFDAAFETGRLAQRLRWQLVDNPARRPEHAGGHFLRDADGCVVGTHLAIPIRFACGERRLVGLLSADLRAEPRAARWSSGMFLAYLRLPGADFHYATTANLNSGAFWVQRRAPAVAESELELIFPVRFGPFLEELARRRGAGATAARAARLAGASTGWLARARGALAGTLRAPRGFAVTPCSDWERLAALAERQREPALLTNERSAAYLRWRYQDCPGGERNRVLRVEAGGHEAWAALQLVTLGRGRLREARLMDLVWPRGALDATEVLRAVLHQCRRDCDMIRIKGGTLPARDAERLGFWQRRLEGPTSFVLFGGGAGSAPPARFVAADSDTP